MKNKVFGQIGLSIMVCALLVACCGKGSVTPPETEAVSSAIDGRSNFFDKNVLLATGIDFQTKKSVVLNPITGAVEPPCKTQGIVVNSGKYAQQAIRQQRLLDKAGARALGNQEDCNAQIVDPSPELTNAIKSSENIIDGTIRRVEDGKVEDVEAAFVVSVTALYPGSNCATYISGGKQYKFCSDTQGNCNLVSPVLSPANPGYAASNNDSYRRAVRNICKQFSAWKTKDCTFLKPRYRTVSPYKTMYALPYKQSIWDSCHPVPHIPKTWGDRPTATAP